MITCGTEAYGIDRVAITWLKLPECPHVALHASKVEHAQLIVLAASKRPGSSSIYIQRCDQLFMACEHPGNMCAILVQPQLCNKAHVVPAMPAQLSGWIPTVVFCITTCPGTAHLRMPPHALLAADKGLRFRHHHLRQRQGLQIGAPCIAMAECQSRKLQDPAERGAGRGADAACRSRSMAFSAPFRWIVSCNIVVTDIRIRAGQSWVLQVITIR